MVSCGAERRVYRGNRRRNHRAGGLGLLRAAARQLNALPRISPRRMTEYCAVAPTRLALRHALPQNKAASVFMRQHRQISFPRIRISDRIGTMVSKQSVRLLALSGARRKVWFSRITAQAWTSDARTRRIAFSANAR